MENTFRFDADIDATLHSNPLIAGLLNASGRQSALKDVRKYERVVSQSLTELKTEVSTNYQAAHLATNEAERSRHLHRAATRMNRMVEIHEANQMLGKARTVFPHGDAMDILLNGSSAARNLVLGLADLTQTQQRSLFANMGRSAAAAPAAAVPPMSSTTGYTVAAPDALPALPPPPVAQPAAARGCFHCQAAGHGWATCNAIRALQLTNPAEHQRLTQLYRTMGRQPRQPLAAA